MVASKWSRTFSTGHFEVLGERLGYSHRATRSKIRANVSRGTRCVSTWMYWMSMSSTGSARRW